MQRSELIFLARNAYRDPDSMRAAFAPGVEWHVPGANPVSGTYRGAAAYFVDRLERMEPLDRWELEIVTIYTNEAASSALLELRLRGERKGARVDMTSFHMLRFDGCGKVVEATGFVENQELLDAFFEA